MKKSQIEELKQEKTLLMMTKIFPNEKDSPEYVKARKRIMDIRDKFRESGLDSHGEKGFGVMDDDELREKIKENKKKKK